MPILRFTQAQRGHQPNMPHDEDIVNRVVNLKHASQSIVFIYSVLSAAGVSRKILN